jgi:hypothetical protein
LSSKGYSVVPDPVEAAYLLHTQVVYCHKAGDGVRPETVAKSDFGAASAAVGRLSATGMMWSACSMSRRCGQGQRGAGAMPDVNAMMRTAMSGRGGYQAMAQPSQSDDCTYPCVADVLVTEHSKNSPARTYKMRSVAHVLQKKLNIEEATPIIREKFAASMTGAF